MTWTTGNVRHLTDERIDAMDGAHKKAMAYASALLRDKCLAARGMLPFERPRQALHIPTDVKITPVRSWYDVVNMVAQRYNVSPRVLVDPDAPGQRIPKNLRARYVAFWIFHKRGMSYPWIGRRLGGRDHSTVIKGIRRIEVLATPDERAFVEDLCPVVEDVAEVCDG